jgi:hypothetical protein
MEEAHLSRLASIVAVSGCVTFSLALLLYHHQNRKQLLLRSLGEKPQRKFKRVLADNSSLPFCHLHPQGKNGKLLIVLNICKTTRNSLASGTSFYTEFWTLNPFFSLCLQKNRFKNRAQLPNLVSSKVH